MTPSGQSTSQELFTQWQNPSDILSLLLLIGGEIVQKALARLTGYCVAPFGHGRIRVSVAPVAFSFGWVAFGFTSLMSAMGDQQLMPAAESAALIVNCANSFTRDNQSWLLERLLGDYEARHQRETKAIASMRIDIFELSSLENGEQPNPVPDRVWWTGWLTIAAQLGISVVPWVLHGNWGVILVLGSGTLLALFTSAMPQWRQEKWSGAKLDLHSVHALTRGNGSRYVMVFIGSPGSYNLESMATARADRRPETPVIMFILAALWACLLICTSGLSQNSWYMIGIGGLGMVQNVYAAGAATSTDWTALKMKPFRRKPTIVAGRLHNQKYDDRDADVDLEEAAKDVVSLDNWLTSSGTRGPRPVWLDTMKVKDGAPEWLQPVADEDVARAQGALQELEKWVPTAGLALLSIFFPGHLEYNDSSIRDNTNKKFWRRAWHTKRTRRRAEHARKVSEAGGRPKGP